MFAGLLVILMSIIWDKNERDVHQLEIDRENRQKLMINTPIIGGKD